MKVNINKQISEDLLTSAGLIVDELSLSYLDSNNEELFFEIDDIEKNNISLNSTSSYWSPQDNNLILKQNISIEKPSEFFGSKGVTSNDNILGLAIKVNSRKSNFSYTEPIVNFSINSERIDIEYRKEFLPNTLSGQITFSYYFYLNELKSDESFFENSIGAILSEEPIHTFTISVDGDGSEFPIELISDPNEPLWKVRMDWADVTVDTFDKTYVSLVLNKAHSLYTEIDKARKINQYLLNDIFISAMILIVQKAIFEDHFDLDINAQYETGSIAQVIKYWVSSYNINLTNLNSVASSFRKGAENNFEG